MNLNYKKNEKLFLFFQSFISYKLNKEEIITLKQIFAIATKIIILLILLLFFINNNSKKYEKNINSIFYEENIDFSNYSTDFKAIAIFT